jgi:hypothetical protein
MVVIVPVVAVLVVCTVIRVSTAIALLVAVEVFDMLRVMMSVEVFAARRILAMPAIVTIIVIIDVSPEMGRAAIPGPSADKDSAGKPLRSVVAIRRAIVGWIVEIAIGA